MTINNLALCEATIRLRQLADDITMTQREGTLLHLGELWAMVEVEAREAGYVVNDLLRPNGPKA